MSAMPDELTADRIRAYLAGTGWTLGPIGAGAALWQRYGGSIRLPHEMTDWDLGKAVMDIGIAEDRHPGDIHADVLAYDGPAVGGPVRSVSPPLESGCTFTLPPREHLERLAAKQGVRPVMHIDDLAAAPEDRPSDKEAKAFLYALSQACGSELDDLDILLAALMRRLGDEVELSQDEIEDARRRLRDEEWHFVAFHASFLAPDLVTIKMRSRPRKPAHAAWSDVRAARMDSPAAQAGHQTAADEHNSKEQQ